MSPFPPLRNIPNWIAGDRQYKEREFKKRTGASRSRSVGSKSKVLKRSYQKTHVSGMPQSLRQAVTFAELVPFAGIGAASYIEAVYGMNCLYDPNLGAGTGQPASFARLMQVYTKAAVKAAKIRVTFSTMLTAISAVGIPQAMIVGVTISTNGTTLGSFEGAVEPGLNNYGPISGSPASRTIELTVDCNKFLDITNNRDEVGQFNNSVSANPGQLVVAHVWMHNHSTAAGVYAQAIEIQYDVDFYDPVPVT